MAAHQAPAPTAPPRPGKRQHWLLTSHVCRACFGRVLRSAEAIQVDEHDRWHFTCSNCGLTELGTGPEALCACGFRLKGGRDPGLRCEHNRTTSPEFPSLIIAAQQRIEGQR